MKKIILITLITIFTTSCKQDSKNNTIKNSTIKTAYYNPLLGTWTRSFELEKNSIATVSYTVFKDSIQYEMKGALPIKYSIIKDTFDLKNNRWVGKRNNASYVIFIKDISKDSITLLKMKVKSKTDALTMAFPNDTAKSRFSSWNTFVKN